MIGADHPESGRAGGVSDIVVVHDPHAGVVLGAGVPVGAPPDVAGLDDGVRRLHPGVGPFVGEDAGLQSGDVAGGGERRVGLVGPQIDVGESGAGRVVVAERAVHDGDEDGGAGLGEGDGRGSEAGLDVGVLAAVPLVLLPLVHKRGEVAGGLGDLEDETGARVDDVLGAVVAPAESGGGRGGQQSAADEQGGGSGGGRAEDTAAAGEGGGGCAGGCARGAPVVAHRILREWGYGACPRTPLSPPGGDRLPVSRRTGCRAVLHRCRTGRAASRRPVRAPSGRCVPW